jgi:hypothetical protein
MRAPVTHINLLQGARESHATAWIGVALLTLTIAVLAVHGSHLQAQSKEDLRRRDEMAEQVVALQKQLNSRQAEKAKSGTALSLQREIDSLRPQAQATQVLLDALGSIEKGRTDEFSRPLVAMTGLNESGLWLTTLTVSDAGRRLELQGQAMSGAPVLRFARRANASLQPLALRLDSLEMQPVESTVAGSGGVSFRLY